MPLHGINHIIFTFENAILIPAKQLLIESFMGIVCLTPLNNSAVFGIVTVVSIDLTGKETAILVVIARSVLKNNIGNDFCKPVFHICTGFFTFDFTYCFFKATHLRRPSFLL